MTWNNNFPIETTVEAICGNSIKTVPTLGKFDFVFADPPFNIGQDYDGFHDKQKRDVYEWTINRSVRVCWEACSGVLALHGPDDLVELYLQFAKMFKMPRIAWINWHYRFGQCGRGNWIDARCHCLLFAKHDNYTWNPESVLVESDRASTYDDKRIHETKRGGMRLPGTVWGVPSDGPYWGRVQGNNKERRKGHPNQLPEVYLERLIKAYTNPGDRILDPFGGSGTTAVVAKALDRSCVTVDISQTTVDSINKRLTKGAVRV